jgi:3-phosphoshikimate 1-carboxyvinyltransferase
MLPDPYPVPVWTAPCRSSVRVPGSKSLTNRALILAALCEGSVRLEGALFSRDSQLLVENLRSTGFSVRTNPASGTMEVEGTGGRIPTAAADLYVGNAGTVARFMTAFLCLHPHGNFRIDGDEEMRKRPMTGLLDTLRALGAEISFEGQPNCFPFTIHTRGLPGGRWQVDATASSQMLSALMMVAPFASGDVVLDSLGARPAFVNMTAALMRQFGADLEGSPATGFRISSNRRYAVPSRTFPIEPDATAASYFLTLPLVVGGELTVEGLHAGMLQGDTAYGAVLQTMGLGLEEVPDGWRAYSTGAGPEGDQAFDFECFSDTFLTLAAVAPLFPCPVMLTGIGHTRHQETDRIHAMTTELRRVGATVEEGDDFIRVFPFAQGSGLPDEPARVQTYRDHRVAMSFAVLGSRDLGRTGRSWLAISDPGCCSKTFPGFFEVLHLLYQNCHDK